ncbi:RsmB/NOP family class I SAM-dependent RNA methyltransferase [Corynebacterium heidelbergense]|uniref:Methyltransferase n=1 Tax=Corynebacterium heidelbergense TaxID=2055947 RepID=A0A364V9A2_9CORY|nr:transcription antitermination factor NusB [Corynebacterium heidelbergense]RAV33146.1 methyltransferase [Corynebacterium heidelbergense]
MGGFRSRSESARANRSNAQKKNPTPAPRRPARSVDPVRELCLDVLGEVHGQGAYGNLVLPGALRAASISGRDAAFATELTYGCLRATGQLDAVIEMAAGRPIGAIDPPVLDALRLGTYQILHTRVEPHAAVDTTVELVRHRGFSSAAGFANGVLRTITRTPAQEWLRRIAPGTSIGDVALRSAHPRWIADAINNALLEPGADTDTTISPELAEALAANNRRPAVHLAARPGAISQEELALVTGGETGAYSPYAVYLPSGDPGDLDAIRQGLASVQDEGSQLVALALCRAPLGRVDRGRWLDLCSGPGGKTAFLAAWGQGAETSQRVRVDAIEVTPHRADLVEKATRGLPVRVHTGDGRDLRAISSLDMPAGYDRVLVDAPCTGLGALRRRPEARWRKSPEDVAELVALQRELLAAGLAAAAPGGVVVYSTCSPHLAETREVAHAVARSEGAEILDASAILPEVPRGAVGPFIQLWPHRHSTDAMFIAALRKPGDSGGPEASA